MAAPIEASSLQPGLRVLGRYELVRELGRGGMGVVWLVQDHGLGIECALKFLPDVLRQDRTSLDELRDEARRNLRLTNESIVRIYDFVEDTTYAGISMEYVDGETLASRKANAPQRVLEVDDLYPLVRQLCRALHYAHTQPRVVHRDLKPANLMITRDGRLKITDFGIARSISDSITRVSNAQASSGTLVYMSPQQLLGEPAKPSDDIYSIGATIFDLLSGKPPFHTGSVAAQLLQSIPPTMAERRAQLERAGRPIPAAWEETVAACLAKDPRQRPATTLDVIRHLEGGHPAKVLDPGETLAEPVVLSIPKRPEPATAPPPTPTTLTPAPTRPPTQPASETDFTQAAHELPDRNALPATNYSPAPPQVAVAEPRRSSAGLWIALSIFFLLLLVAAGGIIVYFAKDHLARINNTPPPAPPPPPAVVTDGSIQLNTIPTGARVWIDGKEAGVTPLRRDRLSAADHRLRIEREGYEPLDMNIEIAAGPTTNPGVLHLVPLPKKAEPVAPVPSIPATQTNLPAPPPPPQPVPSGLTEAAARAVVVRILEATARRDFVGLVNCYTDPVDYFDEGNHTRYKLEVSIRKYFDVWPLFEIQVLSSSVLSTADPDEKVVNVSYRFTARNGKKFATGVAHDSVTIRRYRDGNFARRIRQEVTDRKKNF